MNASLRLNHHSLVALVVAVGFGVLGCGGSATNKITVSGTVSYKGEPVASGLLQFTGENNAYYGAASLLPDGSYIMTDVVPGEVKVSIMPAPGGSGSSSGEKSKPAPKLRAELPDRYRSPQTSGLKYPINPDTRELKIEIP